MSLPVFDGFLTTREMAAVFDAPAVLQAMFRFEAELARAQAREGVIPASAAVAIAGVCRAELYDLEALVDESRRAGSLAIPLVKALTRTVALFDAEAARHVHWGGTSQDVIDTAMALVSREALALLQRDLARLVDALLAQAARHAGTPVLARTLMQPAQVTTLGLKLMNWAAPLQRSQAALAGAGDAALALQFGGAIGTRSVLDHDGSGTGARVAARMAEALGLRDPGAAWHTQRDELMRLASEIAVLTGSLGKVATDLSLMAQGEVAELAEPAGAGRGGSSAMPHKRNPVSALLALAAAQRAPGRLATMLSAMAQQHERGLGNWQAELAEWPGLFLGAHAAVAALAEAFEGLEVDAAHMRGHIDALRGLVCAEAAGRLLAGAMGREAAHHLLEGLSRRCVAEARPLAELLDEALAADPGLAPGVDRAAVRASFDPQAAAAPARAIVDARLGAHLATADALRPPAAPARADD